MTATTTALHTRDGLCIYDLDPLAAELWAVAGPDGYDPEAIDPDALPPGFRWVTGEEYAGATTHTLLAAAEAAAQSIEQAAAACGATYHAAQTFYGVEAEALVADEWLRLRDLPAGAEVAAVRLFDCDGNRSAACRTVEQIEAERIRWVEGIELDDLDAD